MQLFLVHFSNYLIPPTGVILIERPYIRLVLAEYSLPSMALPLRSLKNFVMEK